MVERLRKHLLRWLNVPSPEVTTDDLTVLKDRMDTLERMIMTQIQQPDNGSGMIPATSDRDLAVLPDAHLGAQ